MTKPEYKKIIKAFEEDINRNHLVKVKNVKVSTNVISADIHLISIYQGHKETTIYYDCKYLRKELDSRYIFQRTYKSRWNAY